MTHSHKTFLYFIIALILAGLAVILIDFSWFAALLPFGAGNLTAGITLFSMSFLVVFDILVVAGEGIGTN